MEKIKSLSPWEIFDLWETDAGTMDFADMYDRDQLRFRVHMHDAHTGFDHTSTAYIDGAFFFQMPRAEYKDWARKAVHQNDSDIFPCAGKIIDKFEVIPHG